MRALVLFTLLFLAGCSNQSSLQPLTQTITGKSEGDATQILWLDERQNIPESLTQLMMLGEYGRYKAEYRWQDGEMREIERKGKVLLQGEMKEEYLFARFDSKKQAIYQKYLINGEIFPLRKAELARYYEDALKVYGEAKRLKQKNMLFFQGRWQGEQLQVCGNVKTVILGFSKNIPDEFTQNSATKFLAAVGEQGLSHYTVDQIIAINKADTPCFTRPTFDKNES